MDAPVLVDEQGDYFPPANALAAFLEGYGNEPQYDGSLVELSAYLPDQDMFETVATSAIYIDGKLAHGVGEVVYAYPRELRPINKASQKYIKTMTEVAVEIYDMEVYNLRDLLGLIDINVKAESIAQWSASQRNTVERYAAAVFAQANDHRGVKVPPKPKELL